VTKQLLQKCKIFRKLWWEEDLREYGYFVYKRELGKGSDFLQILYLSDVFYEQSQTSSSKCILSLYIKGEFTPG